MKHHRFAILGAGVSGMSAAAALTARGAQVLLFDQSPASSNKGEYEMVGDTDPDSLASKLVDWKPEIVVASPGIPPHSPLIARVKSAGIPLWSEVELAWNLQEESPREGRPWLLVTGTNGKTTTVGILTAILKAAGERVAEVGNVGLPITSQVDGNATVFAVEISSFQLENTSGIQPEASICLNVETDHLDWHGTEAAYAEAKARVYEGVRDCAFYFQADSAVQHMVLTSRLKARTVALSTTTPSAGEIGVTGRLLVDATGEKERVVANLEKVSFLKARNFPHALLEDSVAAAALALCHGVPPAAVEAGLQAFEPDAHRGTTILELGSVRWVDDSKATNAHAAQAALETVPNGSAVWVAGGDAKGQDFSELVRDVAPKLKAAILIGKNRDELRRALYQHAPQTPIVEVMGAGNVDEWMGSVVRKAAEIAGPGDTVMLAPACASWDQFSNYSHRGDVFAAAVMAYAETAGIEGE